MRVGRLFLPLQGTLLMDLLPVYSVDVVSSVFGRRAGKSRPRSGNDGLLRYRIRCSSGFSRTMGMFAVWVFDARWAGGTTGWARWSPT